MLTWVTWPLIESSGLGRRIQYLCSNSDLAYTPLFRDSDKLSNCWGTTVYVLGQENAVRELAEELLKRKRIKPEDLVLPKTDRPGYVGERLMVHFLTENGLMEETDERSAHCVSFWYDGAILSHSGIHLGRRFGDSYMFHQNGAGGWFRITSKSNWCRRHWYDRVRYHKVAGQ